METRQNPIRVLQVATKMDRGGLETMIMNYYRKMDRSKIQFDFLLHRTSEGAYDSEIKRLGGRLYFVPRANPLNPRYYKAVSDFFARHKEHSIVHSHIDCMSAPILSAARRHGVSVRIAHSHNSFQDKDLKYPVKVVAKKFITRHATHLLACSKDAGKWMFETDDFEIMHNAIDIAAFEFDLDRRLSSRKSLGIEEGVLTVGHVGRFSTAKNHDFILKVFASLAGMSNQVVLMLVGDGERRPLIEMKAREMGLSDKIKFLGSRDDVPNLMNAMDVFLMPSIYEGLPLVLVEAQAAGLPCVISNAIPRDCDITRKIKRLELAEPPSVWAEAVIAHAGLQSRVDGFEIVRQAGFDVAFEAKKLGSFYLESVSKKND